MPTILIPIARGSPADIAMMGALHSVGPFMARNTDGTAAAYYAAVELRHRFCWTPGVALYVGVPVAR